jgi:UDP-glucose 4-epimerase
MRILVTGGAGYVGSVSVESFVAAGHEVTALDDLSTGHRDAVAPGALLVVGSYGDTGSVKALLERNRIEAVLHCAAKSLVPESMADPAKYYRENVAGGVALLEAMRLAAVKRIVFSSTAATYGLPERTPIVETDPVRPINPYGETKRAVEGAINWYGQAYGLRGVILRYFNVAGASTRFGEVHRPESHLIPVLLDAIAEDREATLYGDDYPTPDGTCVRDYIHVEDLAQAHLLALVATAESDARTGPAGGPCSPLICNLGNGYGFSNRQVVSTVEAVVGRKMRVKVGPRRPGDPPILVASSRKAVDVLGWHPNRSSLDAMIRSAWEWRQAHPAGYVDEAAGRPGFGLRS